MSKTREVRFSTLARAEPASVFDALATAEGLDRWFTRGGSTLEPGDVGLRDMLNRASGWAQALTLMKFWVEHGVTY